MQALLGVVIGASLGFLSAWLMTRLERRQTKVEVAKLLLDEISSNRQRLERILTRFETGKDVERHIRQIITPFMREVFASCVPDLALLPLGTRVEVQRFYALLGDIEFVVQEGYLRQSIFLPSERKPSDDSWGQLQDWLEDLAERGLEAADKALLGLKEVIGQR